MPKPGDQVRLDEGRTVGADVPYADNAPLRNERGGDQPGQDGGDLATDGKQNDPDK